MRVVVFRLRETVEDDPCRRRTRASPSDSQTLRFRSPLDRRLVSDTAFVCEASLLFVGFGFNVLLP